MKFCCVGDNCIDYYQHEKIAKPGGNPVNVAVYIHQLGGESSYVGAIGTDNFGIIMIDALKAQNVDISNVQIVDGKTAVTMVQIIDNDRVFGDYDEGVMKNFSLNDQNRSFILQHDIVISGYWGNIAHEFKNFKNHNITTAFDFATNLESELTLQTIPYIDYAFFSNDEKNDTELENYMKGMHAKGAKTVIVTRGKKGSVVFDGKNFYHFGIINCPVVDTLGAGDSYIAGFLYAIMQKKTIVEAMEAGAKRSAITIGYEGAW